MDYILEFLTILIIVVWLMLMIKIKNIVKSKIKRNEKMDTTNNNVNTY